MSTNVTQLIEEAEVIAAIKRFLRQHPSYPDASATISDVYSRRKFNGIPERQKFLSLKKAVAVRLADSGALKAAGIGHGSANNSYLYWLHKPYWPGSRLMQTAQTNESRRRDDFVLILRQQGYSRAEIGKRLMISTVRVKQIEDRAVRRREYEWNNIGVNLTIIERELKAWPKVISKVSGPLNDTRSSCTIESGGST